MMRNFTNHGFRALMMALLFSVTVTTNAQTQPTGAINGLFTIAAGQQVYFSKGNLQYRASTNTWRFAEHQWDMVGTGNNNISSTYSGWIDLFGWGTSGYNHGAVCYQPWSVSTESGNYLAYGYTSAGLEDYSGQADWGYNPISNGGNQSHQWKTLSAFELAYVLVQRTTESGMRFAKATVNGVQGLILLPDNWSSSVYALNSVNDTEASTAANVISASNWTVLEQHGAVFLPFASYRYGSSYYELAGYSLNYYATTTNYNDHDAYYLIMAETSSTKYITFNHSGKCIGSSVRLVYPVASVATLPTVHTESVSNVTAFGASVVGHVSNDGGAAVTERGVCWGTGYSPTISGSHLSSGSGMGQFTVAISNLEPNTTYHAKAYAINSQGVSYGERVDFTTEPVLSELSISQPIVLSLSSVSVSCGINTSGATAVTERGVCWSTSHNPTISGSHASNGAGTGSYTSVINGLNTNTTYYIRAYAVNSYGVGYSEETSVKIPATQSHSGGVLPGKFSVNGVQQVQFSQGNLQYRASTNTWRFTTNQWDYVGADNANISSNYSGWIDLFGWGANGVAHSSEGYQPWSTNVFCDAYNNEVYGLRDMSGTADWGYNAISNGGNQTGLWCTLTEEEMNYLFTQRSTTSGVRYVRAMVNGVKGIVLLPDNWSNSYYALNNPNVSSAAYSGNMITAYDWVTVLEAHGAVFMPACGSRDGTSVNGVNGQLRYWTAIGGRAFAIGELEFFGPFSSMYRSYGFAVRLAKHVTLDVQTLGVNVTSESTADCYGNINMLTSGYSVSARGVCVSNNVGVHENKPHFAAGTGAGSYTANATGLSSNSTYYASAYAVVNGVTIYGGAWGFGTLSDPPTLETDGASYITETTAVAGGYVYDAGGTPLVERGVCWSTHSNPTIYDAHAAAALGNGINEHYQANLTGLTANTTYYLRAYAINGSNVGYGNELVFVTQKWPSGTLPGSFSVSPGTKVQFSQGNLRYQSSSHTWRFADRQWDYIGQDNRMIAYNTGWWIDLFGWATSHYPNKHDTDAVYDAYGNEQCNLNDQDGSADWGSNAIQNGGNVTNYWRTLTKAEIQYLLENRNTQSGIRYVWAKVNGLNGIVLLPDDWNPSLYSLNNNINSGNYGDNVITASNWETILEPNGAVFLPSSGMRVNTSVSGVGDQMWYWTATKYDSDNAYALSTVFNSCDLWLHDVRTYTGCSVRLVCNSQQNLSQTEELAPGWNWISFALTEVTSLEDALQGFTPANGDIIKSQSGYSTYNAATGEWSGSLNVMTPGQGYIYKRNSNTPTSFTYVQSSSASTPQPSAIPITLVPGWNWISYLLSTETDLETALQNLVPANGDVIKSQSAYSTYNAATGEWSGSLNVMIPGQGYIYKRNSSVGTSFTYP